MKKIIKTILWQLLLFLLLLAVIGGYIPYRINNSLQYIKQAEEHLQGLPPEPAFYEAYDWVAWAYHNKLIDADQYSDVRVTVDDMADNFVQALGQVIDDTLVAQREWWLHERMADEDWLIMKAVVEDRYPNINEWDFIAEKLSYGGIKLHELDTTDYPYLLGYLHQKSYACDLCLVWEDFLRLYYKDAGRCDYSKAHHLWSACHTIKGMRQRYLERQ